MKKRNVFKIFVVIVYLVLIVLYFSFAKFKKIGGCRPATCVKFCSESDRPLEALSTPEFLVTLNSDATVVIEKPCRWMKLLENATLSVNGSIFVNESSVPVNNYCFAKRNMTESESEAEIEETSNATTESGLDIVEETTYVPMICDKETSESMYFLIYLSLIGTTLGFLLLTLMLHIFINALKNVQGKCAIGFVSSLIVACASSRLLGGVLVKIALIFAFAWIKVMIFDVWFVLINFEKSSGGKFKYYGFYVLGFGAFALIMMGGFFANANDIVYIFLAVDLFACLTCFMVTAVKIYDMTGVEFGFSQKRFTDQEKRFVTYLQLFLITLTTWLIEMCNWEFFFSYESLVVADVLVCLQGFLVFVILILKKDARDIVIRHVCCC